MRTCRIHRLEGLQEARIGRTLPPGNSRVSHSHHRHIRRAHYILGQYDEAIAQLEAAKARNPNVTSIRLILAASYMRQGRDDDAQWEIEEVQAINPRETLSHLAQTIPTSHQESLQRLIDDLRRAGLPE